MYRNFHKWYTIRLENWKRIAQNLTIDHKLVADSLEKLKTRVDEYLKNS